MTDAEFARELHRNARKAMRAGVEKAKLRHAQARVAMAIWKNGKVVLYKPWLDKRIKKKLKTMGTVLWRRFLNS